ncbi:putative Molybdenum cofactor biosynthesis protein [Leptomonas seymouri]|uniref:Putative Molybdenum cofactor biosynthesis protein n=1 Tax=Leptomonas seymouri TaxID=5684 RepID=A0A0N1IIP1_LEPSE|nr:putative Molybdenum cofactor biosynthesis protein [Leptomonas seymouri]|eukprot:KPI84300.1 putative Molybdenum cofactor biosynthesis protein [Leptomonas seymouri]
MLHRCIFQLAKKKGPTPRSHVLRRSLRRSGSGGGVGASVGRRAGSAAAKRSGKDRPSSGALVREKSGRAGVGSGGSVYGEDGGGSSAAAAGTSAAPLAPASDEPAHPSPTSARRPLYRLATAVSTVIVPPTTNVYLQSMKHLLTPASSPTLTGASISEMVGAGPPAVPIIEEYYTSKKGPLFATAVVAGTNAVKQVSSLIPFCYPTPIQRCSFTFRRRQVQQQPRPSQMPHRVVLRRRTTAPGQPPIRPEYSVLYCFCTVATESKAGVEMEALTGATMASVTLYDMLKGLPGAQEDGLSLGEAFVLAKRGGRNDFTKLLMSEPERLLVESGIRSESGVPAIEPPKSSSETTANDIKSHGTAGTAAAALGSAEPLTSSQEGSAKQQYAANAVRGVVNTEDSGEEDVPQRVIRRAAAVAATAEGNEVDDPNATVDTGAWWRTSKQEKRLQELYPRRKYVDGSRVVPTSPPAPEEATPGKRAASSQAFVSGDKTTAAVATASRPKHLSKASMIRDGRSVTSAVSAKAALRSARDAAADNEAAEEKEEDEGVVEHRRPNKSRLAKKTGRGVVSVEADADEVPVKETPLEDEEATAGEEEGEVHDEEEIEPSKGNRKAKRGSSVTSPAHKTAKAAGKRGSAAPTTTAAQRRQQATAEAEEDEANEEEEEEEEIVAPSRKPSHASPAAVVKRHGKGSSSSAHTAAPSLRSQPGSPARKQRAAAAAAALPSTKRARAAALEEEDEDESASADEDDYASEDEEEIEAAAVEEEEEAVTRRGKSAKSSAAAATSSKKKASVMRQVRHSSWDEVTRTVGDDEDAEVGEEVEDVANEIAEEDEEESTPPPPLPKKKVKKTVKRTVPKRR